MSRYYRWTERTPLLCADDTNTLLIRGRLYYSHKATDDEYCVTVGGRERWYKKGRFYTDASNTQALLEEGRARSLRARGLSL